MHLDDEPLLNYTSKQMMMMCDSLEAAVGLKSAESKINLVKKEN
jgi:hypothetical protein